MKIQKIGEISELVLTSEKINKVEYENILKKYSTKHVIDFFNALEKSLSEITNNLKIVEKGKDVIVDFKGGRIIINKASDKNICFYLMNFNENIYKCESYRGLIIKIKEILEQENINEGIIALPIIGVSTTILMQLYRLFSSYKFKKDIIEKGNLEKLEKFLKWCYNGSRKVTISKTEEKITVSIIGTNRIHNDAVLEISLKNNVIRFYKKDSRSLLQVPTDGILKIDERQKELLLNIINNFKEK